MHLLPGAAVVANAGNPAHTIDRPKNIKIDRPHRRHAAAAVLLGAKQCMASDKLPGASGAVQNIPDARHIAVNGVGTLDDHPIVKLGASESAIGIATARQ